MKYPKIVEASKATQIDALIDGLPVVGNGYFFTEEMMDNVEASLAANTASAERIAELQDQLTAANTARVTAEENLTAATATITAKEEVITGLNKQLNDAAAEFTNTIKDNDDQGGAVENYATSDKNPINQLADSVLPKKRK
jgi:DNA-binding ferritin-like protein